MSRFITIVISLLCLLFTYPLLASSSSNVYLASFIDQQQQDKTKISFHHALLTSHGEKLLLELNDSEASILRSKGVKLSPGKKLWHDKKTSEFATRSITKQSSGIRGYECYETVEETFSAVDKLVQDYPSLTNLVDIGDSWKKQNGDNGYDLKVLQIGNKALVDPPILFIQSAMHAREYSTAALTLAFAKMLLEQPDADIDWILNRHQIHILFHTNPDGRKIAERGTYQRKNVNKNHCPDMSIGVDLNRNFSFGWGQVNGGSSSDSCSEVFRGDTPGSEPEVAAVEAYIRSIFPDVRGENNTDPAPLDTKGLYLDVHSYGKLILWPFGHSAQLAPNSEGLEALGKKLAYFNGYQPMQSVGLYPTDGTSDNLAYGELGIAHITFELGTNFFQSCSEYENTIKPDNLKALLYAAKVVEAPYLLTSGPDITDLSITQTSDTNFTVEAIATDTNYNGARVTHNISSVQYSINEYLNEENAQLASFVDDTANKKTRKVAIDLFDDAVEVVYLQATNESGQKGPISAVSIYARPTADATVNCQGARCKFESNNTDDQFSYAWKFDNELISSENEFDFILPNAGEFTISHRVENKINSDLFKEKQIHFTVTELLLPIVELATACDEKTCQFDASNTLDNDSDNLVYLWNFGDSNTSDEITTEHIYTEDGTYIVTLTVTNEHQQEVIKTTTLEINTATEVIIVTPEPQKPSSSGGTMFWLLALLFFSRKIHNKPRLIV